MTYAEKLKTPEWFEFRRGFLEWRKESEGLPENWCDTCRENTDNKLHVHHKAYNHSADPWDYEYSELRLLCADCHDKVHDMERRFAIFVRSTSPSECGALFTLLRCLDYAQHHGVLSKVVREAVESIAPKIESIRREVRF